MNVHLSNPVLTARVAAHERDVPRAIVRTLARVAVVLALPLALGACTWVKVTEAGGRVAQRTAEEVTNCRKLGEASVQTTDKVILARDTRTVQAEVIALAKNQAGTMGGNAIVPASALAGGSQSFDVYTCP